QHRGIFTHRQAAQREAGILGSVNRQVEGGVRRGSERLQPVLAFMQLDVLAIAVLGEEAPALLVRQDVLDHVLGWAEGRGQEASARGRSSSLTRYRFGV